MQTKNKHINPLKHLKWMLLLFCCMAGWQAGWGQYRLEYNISITPFDTYSYPNYPYNDTSIKMFLPYSSYVPIINWKGIPLRLEEYKDLSENSDFREIRLSIFNAKYSYLIDIKNSSIEKIGYIEDLTTRDELIELNLNPQPFYISGTLKWYPIFSKLVIADGKTELPMTNRVRIVHNGKVFDPSLYHWEYSIDNGGSWTDLPSEYQEQREIDLNAKSILTAKQLNANDFQYHNILVRINPWKLIGDLTHTEGASQILSLTIIPDAPALTISTTPPTCYGGSNGKVKVKLKDRDLADGEKLLLTFNANSSNSDSPPQLLSKNDISLTKEYTYQYTGSHQDNFKAGTYTLTWQTKFGTNDQSTPNTASYTIDNPTAVTFTADPSPVQCHGGNDGSIKITASGGSSSTYQYTIDGTSWKNFPTNSPSYVEETPLPSKTYTVNVQNVVGETTCPATPKSVSIGTPSDSISISIPTRQDVTTYGQSTGQLEATVTGGNGGYSYVWKNQSNAAVSYNSSATRLPAGTYTVTVTDSHYTTTTQNAGCTSKKAVTIGQPDELVFSKVTTTPNRCHGDANGKIDVTVTGGLPINGPAYKYQWSKENTGGKFDELTAYTTATLTGLTAGNYKITVTDNAGNESGSHNTIYKTIKLDDPDSIKITPTITNVDCRENATGAITITASGGTGKLHYKWDSREDTVNTITRLPYGNYTVTVKDDSACTKSLSKIFVQQPTQELAIQITKAESPTSFNGTDGVITYVTSGGTAGYSYEWTKDGNTIPTPQADKLSPGKYTITVTDNHNCSSTATEILKNPVPPIELSATSKDVTCYGGANGSISITPSRTPVLPVSVIYSYTWKKNDNQLADLTTNTATDLSAGTYTVTVTDDQGAAAKNIIVTLNERHTQIMPSLSATDVDCHGRNNGSVTITSVSGGAGEYSYLWENGSSKASRSDLAPGKYTVTITDSANCTTSASATIKEPNELTVSLTPVRPTGYNTLTGTITANYLGGNEGSHTYKWQGSDSQTNTAANLPAGDYSVEVTDSKGCSANDSVTLSQPDPLTVSIAVVDSVSCNGSSGTLKAIASGGLPKAAGYSYIWHKLNPDKSTLTELPPATVAANSASLWNGVGAGLYKVTVVDSVRNVLLSDSIFSLTEPAALRDSAVVTRVKCFGESNGVISLTPSGGNGGYSFLCGTDSVANPIAGLAAGSYQVTIKDRKGCFIRPTIAVTQPNKLLTTLTKTVELSAYHTSDGKISATTSGGTRPYAFRWQGTGAPADTLSSFASGLPSGYYSLMVRDSNLCTASASVRLIDPMRVIISVKDSIPCYSQTGALTAHAVGGVPFASGLPYRYEWYKKNSVAYQSIFQNDSSAINLSFGEYMVKVRDAADSIRYQTFTLVQPDPLMAPFTEKNISCNGFNDGAILIQPSGGNGGYRLLWQDNGDTLSLRTNLPPGQYGVYLSDRKGCVTSPVKTTVSITQPDKLVLALQKTEVGLHCGGTIDALATGGTLPYRFSWSNAAPVAQSSQNHLCAGSYPVVVTDANACVASALTYLPPPLIAAVSIRDSVNCYGESNGTLRAHVIGGVPFSSGMPYTYRWSKKNSSGSYQLMPGYADSIASSLASGWYALNVTDSIGKTLLADSIFFLPQPSPLAIRVQKNDVLCYGAKTGSVSALVSGGLVPYRLLWNTRDTVPTLQNIGAGNYSVQVYDRHGCYKQYDALINQSDSIIVGFSSTVAPSSASACDGSLHANVIGGIPPYSYLWSDGSTSATAAGLCAGSFSVAVTDLFGCPATGTKRLSDQSVPLSPSLSIRDSVRCYGFSTGAIAAKVTGGVPFSWGKPYRYIWKKKNSDGDYRAVPNSNDSILSHVSAGWYSLQVMDAQNSVLDNPQEIFLDQPDSIGVRISHSDITCHGLNNGTILAAVTGGVFPYLYQWSNNAPAPATASSLSQLSPGDYTLSVADKNGCISTHQVAIREPEALTVSIQVEPISEYNAANGVVTAIPAGGTAPFTFAWKDTSVVSASMERLAPGSYTVAVTDANSCKASQSASLVNPPPLKVHLSVKDSINCFSWSTGAIKAAAVGGMPFASAQKYRFIWKKKDTAGAWQVLPGYTDSIASGLTAGVYACNMTDAYGAVLHADSLIVLPQPSELNLVTAKSDIGCSGANEGTASAALSGGVPPYSYAWNTGETTAAISGLPAGPYMVRALDSKGCVASRQVVISKAEPLYMSLFSAQPICYNDCNGSIRSNVSGGVLPYSYQWTGVNASAAQTGKLCAGAYALKVVDAAGCSIIKKDTLVNPARLPLSLGANRYICHGQTIRYDISIPGATGISYAWTGSNGFSAASPIVELTRDGSYRASVTDSKGCARTEEVTLLPSQTTVENEFVVPTQAFVNEGIVVVNTTYPVPDSIRWVLPAGAIVDNENQSYAEFYMPQTGSFTIRMISYKGECSSEVDKVLLVSDASQPEQQSSDKSSFIQSFVSAPNPNHGVFQVQVVLQEKADIQIKLINIANNQVVYQVRKSGEASYQVPVNVAMPIGSYLIRLETSKGSASIKAIIF